MIDFDPGVGVQNLITNGISDVFIAKYDSTGNYVWANSFGAGDHDEGKDVAFDINNNILITGIYRGAVDFDPSIGTVLLSSVGNWDIFIGKFDQSGNYIWAKSIGSTEIDRGNSICSDEQGNVLISGYAQDPLDVDPGSGMSILGTTNGQFGIIVKYNINGDYLWGHAISTGGTNSSKFVKTDNNGNVYSAGFLGGTIDFDPGIDTSNFTTNGRDIYVLKYDSLGNYTWAFLLGGSAADIVYDFEVFDDGVFYMASLMRWGDIDIDPSSDSTIVNNDLQGFGSYLIKYSQNVIANLKSSDTNICINDCISFTDTSYNNPTEWIWYFPESTQPVVLGTANPTNICYPTSGSFDASLVVVNSFSYDSLFIPNFIQVTPNPNITISNDISICKFDSTLIYASSTVPFLWNNGLGNLDSIKVSPITTESYVVSSIDTNNCITVDSVIVIVNPIYSINDTLFICQNDSVLIFGQYQSSTGMYIDSLNTFNGCDSILSTLLLINSVYFFNDSIHLCQGDSTLLQGSFQTTDGLYYDTLSTVLGCDSIMITSLEITTIPPMPIVSDTIVCLNEGIPDLVAFGTGLGIIDWYVDSNSTPVINSSTSYTPTINNEGQYEYYISETINGCNSPYAVLRLEVYNPIAILNATPTSGVIPLEVSFINESLSANWYSWNFETGDTSNVFEPSYIFNNEGEYIVTLIISDSFGCIDSTQITIVVGVEYTVSIPNTITPNGDGYNDFWIIENVEQFSDHIIQVFNRNGSLVFESNNYQNDWNGKYKGNDLPATTYYYVIDLGIGEGVLKGDLSIIREE